MVSMPAMAALRAATQRKALMGHRDLRPVMTEFGERISRQISPRFSTALRPPAVDLLEGLPENDDRHGHAYGRSAMSAYSVADAKAGLPRLIDLGGV